MYDPAETLWIAADDEDDGQSVITKLTKPRRWQRRRRRHQINNLSARRYITLPISGTSITNYGYPGYQPDYPPLARPLSPHRTGLDVKFWPKPLTDLQLVLFTFFPAVDSCVCPVSLPFQAFFVKLVGMDGSFVDRLVCESSARNAIQCSTTAQHTGSELVAPRFYAGWRVRLGFVGVLGIYLSIIVVF